MGATDRFSQTIRKDELGEHSPFELRPLPGGRRVGDSTPLSPRPSDAERARDGYAAGREQGYADAQRDMQRARAADLQRLESLLASLQGEFDALTARTADSLLDLAIDIAAQVLRHEVRTHRDSILPVVREALTMVQAARAHPTVRVAPADFELVRNALQGDGQFQGCRFIADPAIAAGGCRVESTGGEVDATLPVRWRRVLQALGADTPLAEAPPAAPETGREGPADPGRR